MGAMFVFVFFFSRSYLNCNHETGCAADGLHGDNIRPSMPFQNNQNCAANHPHVATICVLRYQSDRQHVGLLPFVCFPHEGGTGSNKTDFCFSFITGKHPSLHSRLIMWMPKQKFTISFFFLPEFFKALVFDVHYEYIYKYIYNDDTVIHNNYKMINDKSKMI